MGEKSVGQIVAGLFLGAAASATGATQGDEIRDYARTTRSADENRSEEVSRSVDAQSRADSGKSGQDK